MAELRFDGRVVIVTGAGGRPGLGRAYAHLFAERGAKVVVNDFGIGPDGRDVVRAHADVVAQEIRDAGGEAIADVNSVAEEASAREIVRTALDTWGRVDVLINNAGVINMALFDELSSDDIQRMVNVHLFGNIWMCRAVWPQMRAAGYGRIVNVSSGAALGGRYLSIYGAAKGGIFSLTRSLALEGAEHGILVNSLIPAAFTIAMDILNEETEWKRQAEEMKPEWVAPLVAFLGHEECPVSGACLGSTAGRTFETFISETPGFEKPGVTAEEIRDRFDEVRDRAGSSENTLALNQGRRGFVPHPYQPAGA